MRCRYEYDQGRAESASVPSSDLLCTGVPTLVRLGRWFLRSPPHRQVCSRSGCQSLDKVDPRSVNVYNHHRFPRCRGGRSEESRWSMVWLSQRRPDLTQRSDVAWKMVRRLRKARKQRGSRTCGWGKVGQHRKSGSRGGFGKAGRHKHLWTWVLRYDPDYWGKRGFSSRNGKGERHINVGDLERLAGAMAREGRLTREGDRVVLDLSSAGFGKLLGGGTVLKPFRVVSLKASETAVTKIKEAGGEVVAPEKPSAAG